MSLCEIQKYLLDHKYLVDINKIYDFKNYDQLNEFDLLIFRFPTYHCSPSKTMMDFIEKILRFKEEKKAFVFTTYGLFLGNTLKVLRKKV